MKSEVARLLTRIGQEYEAAMRGLSGVSQGSSKHAFITAKMERMADLHAQLNELTGGDEGIILVADMLEAVEVSGSAP